MPSISPTIKLIGEESVVSANPLSWKAFSSPFHLSPLDSLVAPFIPVAVVFVYKSTDGSEAVQVGKLRVALAQLLDYYPHLTGRLELDPSNGSPFIHNLGSGASLYQAECSERLDSFSLSSNSTNISLAELPGAGNDLLPPFDHTSYSKSSILAIQHTRFACGSVVLGIRSLHMVTDAEGFFQVVRDLAEVYRGAGSLVQIPTLHPFVLETKDEDADFQPSILFVKTPPISPITTVEIPSENDDSPSPPPTPPTIGRFLHFSSQELSAIKSSATNPSPSSPREWVSTFDALCAHFHKRVHLARLKTGISLSPADILAPVNIRSLLDVGPHYTFNALLCSYTSFSTEFLVKASLWEVAKQLHEMTRSSSFTSKEEIVRIIKWISTQTDKREIKSGFKYGSRSLMLSQWNKFDIYKSMVFKREETPVLVAPPFTEISLMDGLGYFVDVSGVEGEAIGVYLALSGETWKALDEDEEFRKFRG